VPHGNGNGNASRSAGAPKLQPLGKPAEIFGASPVNRNRKAVAAIAVAFPVAVADVALELHIA